MNTLVGCRVAQTLHEDPKTGIYRGWRTVAGGTGGDGGEQSVIIKTLRAPYPLLEDVAQLRHEFEIARALPLPGVVQPLALVSCDNAVALLLEDFGGVSLHDFLGEQGGKNGVELDDFFFIALDLVGTLEQIHARGVIHKDLKPDNILINAATRTMKIGDFGIASQLASETPAAEWRKKSRRNLCGRTTTERCFSWRASVRKANISKPISSRPKRSLKSL